MQECKISQKKCIPVVSGNVWFSGDGTMWAQTPWGYSDWLSAETTCAATERNIIQLNLFYRCRMKKVSTSVVQCFMQIQWVSENCMCKKSSSSLTHQLVPAGGWCGGILLSLSCHETTTELCGWLQRERKNTFKYVKKKKSLKLKEVKCLCITFTWA